MKPSQFWISPDVLSWESRLCGDDFYKFSYEVASQRPYRLLGHAESLLGSACTREQRTDADSLLRRFSSSFSLTYKNHDLAFDPYSIDIELELDSGWVPRLSGCVQESIGARTGKPEWIVLATDVLDLRDERIERIRAEFSLTSLTSDPVRLAKFGVGLSPGDYSFRGDLRGPSSVTIGLVRRIFELQQ